MIPKDGALLGKGWAGVVLCGCRQGFICSLPRYDWVRRFGVFLQARGAMSEEGLVD